MPIKTPLVAALEEALARIHPKASGKELPEIVLQLKKELPEAPAAVLSLAAEVLVSRRLAAEKLGAWAQEGFFSKAVLEQASRLAIAEHRAKRFAGAKHVLEVGTGSGSDAAALARVAERVTTVESDPQTAELAQRNFEILGITNVTTIVGAAEDLVPTLLPASDAFFADPARRSRDGTRHKDPQEYSPSLSWLLSLQLPEICAIKVSPGLFVEPCPTGWTRQFCGVADECLDQTLWRGAPVADSSVVLADRGVEWSPPAGVVASPLAEKVGAYIYEAHALLNRCQHLAAFFAQRGIALAGDNVSYGFSEELAPSSPLLSRFSVVDSMPFHAKPLRSRLASLGWTSRTEFKKRSVQVDPDSLRREMQLPDHSHGAPFGVVFVLPWQGKQRVVLAERISD